MALIRGRVRSAAGRVRRGLALTRVRTRLDRRPADRGARPTASAGLGLERLDLTGLTVLDDPAADGTVTADVVVLRDLHRAEDPATAVFRLRERTRVLAVIETPATEWPGHEERGLIEVRPVDPGAERPERWSPSADGVRELCLAAGFTDVRFVTGPPAYRPRGWRPVHYRLVVHARP